MPPSPEPHTVAEEHMAARQRLPPSPEPRTVAEEHMAARQRWGKENFRSKLELLLDYPNGRARPVLPLPLSTWGEPSTRRTSIAHSLQANVHKKQAMEAAMASLARELDTRRAKARLKEAADAVCKIAVREAVARQAEVTSTCQEAARHRWAAEEIATEAAREAATHKAEVAADALQARINSTIVAWAALATHRAAAAAWCRCLVCRNEGDADEACRAEASFVCVECFPAFEANITIKTSIGQRSIW
ncbi:hypothetical protein T492DRAFT_895221 [Pavlovales sp. CCMP2436]|nr:hypothetical protein T492DRAFT_895221 [Pavlovales sp. CCMP2436]